MSHWKHSIYAIGVYRARSKHVAMRRRDGNRAKSGITIRQLHRVASLIFRMNGTLRIWTRKIISASSASQEISIAICELYSS